MKIYDITATINEQLPAYKDGERPLVEQTMFMAKGDACNFSRFMMTMHSGTHADVPLHFVDGGAANDTVDLAHFFGAAKVFRLAVTAHVTRADLLPLDIQAGDIVLLCTGQSIKMQTPKFDDDYIALALDAAEYLVERGVKTVGVDYLSVEASATTHYTVHKALLGNGVGVLEGLVLADVPEGEYTLAALPLKIEGGNGSPVRAILAMR
ncbi:MAG: cyclase family protein [Defluviitaleaceae bacterium]|nr:cyclase family protein [Defluviitaleaceae bacterium]